MSKIQNSIKEIFKSLSKTELTICLISFILSITLFIVMCCLKDNDGIYGVCKWQQWIGLLANITNIITLILAIKKYISNFIWCNISCIFMGALSYDSKMFGMVIVYWCICIVSQTCLYFQWRKESKNKITIEPQKMKNVWFAIYVLIIILFGIGFSFIEGIDSFSEWWTGSSTQTYEIRLFDSLGLVFTIGSIYPLWKRYNQIWVIYLLGDGFMTILWAIQLAESTTDLVSICNSINLLIILVTLLALSISGMINWKIKN